MNGARVAWMGCCSACAPNAMRRGPERLAAKVSRACTALPPSPTPHSESQTPSRVAVYTLRAACARAWIDSIGRESQR